VAGVAILGGVPVVMPRGCRLWLNLVIKYCASGVICDFRIHYLGRSIITSARYYSNKWYRSRRSEKTGKTSPGHMVTGEPVNVSGGSHGWL
jgi:hypothetical protein